MEQGKNRIGKRVLIKYNIPPDLIFRYRGVILEEGDNFIKIDDEKEGQIDLLINRIISIKDFDGGDHDN